MSIAADQKIKALEQNVKTLMNDVMALKQAFAQFSESASKPPPLGLPKTAQKDAGRH